MKPLIADQFTTEQVTQENLNQLFDLTILQLPPEADSLGHSLSFA